MLRTLIAALLFALLPVPACAQDTTAGSAECADAMTTLDMRRCFSTANVRADSAMADTFRAARDRSGVAAALDSAQARWERFRDAQCEAEGARYEGGTLQPVAVLTCRLGLTRARVRYLENLFGRPED